MNALCFAAGVGVLLAVAGAFFLPARLEIVDNG